jgi:formamidopyrimidine-DNA glycosylase
MTEPRASEAVAMLQEHCAGLTLARVLVHGINALKTVDPPLSAITGASLDAAAAKGDATVEILAGRYVLTVDLQRTGRLKLEDPGRAWSPGEPSMPTVQLVFHDGLVVNFVEPGKTKRVTLRASASR